MKRVCIILSLLLCICSAGIAGTAEGSGLEWYYNTLEITLEDGTSISTVSVSPSGRFIACADLVTVNIDMRLAGGAPNPMGRMPDTLYLFEKSGTGYALFKAIPIDTEGMPDLSSTIGGGSYFAWSDDEKRAVIASNWGAGAPTMSYTMVSYSNLFLLDIETESFTRLTDVGEETSHCVLPRWADDNTVRYLYSSLETGMQWNGIREIDLSSGQDIPFADLFNDGGRVTTVYSWDSFGDTIYYTVLGMNPEGTTGLYASDLKAFPENARCLVNTMSELAGTGKHPYSLHGFSSVEISPDGKLACLSVNDMRIVNRDFPLSDSETLPQDDPANAVSAVNGRPWVPCHDVYLYDLENEALVDPFSGHAFDPAKAVVTGACFMPDGRLLCCVFGDDGDWTMDDFSKGAFYYVDLNDFSASRAFECELASAHWFPSGIEILSDGTVCIYTDTPPYYQAQLFLPAE